MNMVEASEMFGLPVNGIRAVAELSKDVAKSAQVCGHFGFVVNDNKETVKAAQTAITSISKNGDESLVGDSVAKALSDYRTRLAAGLPKPVVVAPVVVEPVVEVVEASPEVVAEVVETVAASEPEVTVEASEPVVEESAPATEVVAEVVVKRGVGRPKGSKNANSTGTKLKIVATGKGRGRPSLASQGKETAFERVVKWVQASSKWKGVADTSDNRSALALAICLELGLKSGSANAYVSTGFKANAFA